MPVARGNIKTTIVMDGDQEYTRKLALLKKQQAALRSETRALSASYDENTKSSQKLKDRQSVLERQVEAQKQTVEAYREELNKLESAEKKDEEAIASATAKYNNAQASLSKLEGELSTVERELKTHGEQWQNTGKQIQDSGEQIKTAGKGIENAGRSLSVVSAAAAGGLYTAANAAIDYESAFAGVKKTVDASQEEFDALYDAMLTLSTEIPATASEIAAVGEIAGQLGIHKDNLLEFSQVMINLGQSTNLSAEDAASALAKFANVTDMSADDYEKLGSVIVDLGNNFATTESDIVSMATRLASSGTITGLSQSQIMALATALSSVGIEAEAGGSAAGKVLKTIQVAVEKNSDSLKDWASVSNMSVTEFKALFEKDALSALGAFTQGLNDTERNGKSASVILDEMGLKEIRLSNALLALSTSNDILSESAHVANEAWQDGTALVEEAGKRYETLESKLQIVKNTLTKVAIEFGEELMPYIEDGAEWIKELAERFSELDDKQKRNILRIAGIIAIGGPAITMLGKATIGVGSFVSTIGKLTNTIGKLKSGEAVFAIQKLHRALASAGTAESEVAGGAAAAGAAISGPLIIGVLAATAAISALVIAYKNMTTISDEAKEGFESVADAFENAKEKFQSASGDIEGIKEGLDFSVKDSEIKSEYKDIQNQIRDIAQVASDERRRMTDDEKQELEELFEKLHLVSGEEMKLFETTQNIIQTKIESRKSLSSDVASELSAETEEACAQQTAAIEQRYDAEIALIQETHEKAGTLNSEAYKKEIEAANQHHDELIAAARNEAAENEKLINDKLFANIDGYENALKAFEDYNASMEAAEDDAVNTLKNSQEDALVVLTFAGTKQARITEEFSENFLSKNQETLGAFLAHVDAMASAGYELSDDQKKLTSEIIKAYDSMSEDGQKTWKEMIEGIKETLKNSDISLDAEKIGEDYGKGINRGLIKTKGEILRSIKGITDEMKKATKAGLEERSPSHAAERMAVDYNRGFPVGFKKSKSQVIKELQQEAKEFVNATSDVLSDKPSLMLAAQYQGAIASARSFQQALYYHTVYNNIYNQSKLNNYYSSAAGSGNYDASLGQIVSLLQSIASESGKTMSERQAALAIERCLKSTGIRLR